MSNSSEWADYKALVVGCGSIGRRHAKNLKSLGIRRFAFCDTNADALKQCSADVQGELFTDYREALQKFRPDLSLICTPPVYHVEEASAALQAGSHVFIEKTI